MNASTSSTRTIIAILVVVGLAVAFWMLLLSPKREEASELSAEVGQLQATLAESQSKIATGEAARREFPRNYRQLVVLGKAVPASDESASLLIQLNHIADRSQIKFESLQVGTPNGSESTEASAEEPSPAPSQGSGGATGVPASSVAATEAAASLQPIGATVGPAGLSVLPYDLSFKGDFFHVADFIKGIDSLIHTGGRNVAVDGRLVTLDGFALSADAEDGFPRLNANFSVTTYLVPPGQGITAGASPAEPGEAEPNSSTTVSSNLR